MRQCCVDENLTIKKKRIYESARKKRKGLSVVKTVSEQERGLKTEKETLGSQQVRSRTLKGVVVQLMN